MKELLKADSVLANYDPVKPTRLYVDHGPEDCAALSPRVMQYQGRGSYSTGPSSTTADPSPRWRKAMGR